ncbi:MAG TPA: hypothetical protein VGA34_09820 [Alteraurantiacibacter sp.]
MASIPFSTDTDRGEARFFFIMACLMAATIVAGFSFNIVVGRSSFALPPVYHFHAIVMMGGLGLYVVQNSLILAGNVALHRRLGWVAMAWVPLMVLTGLLLTRISLQERGGPPFFDQNQFLISNPLHLFGFAAMIGWAITARRNTGWHRRLMYCGFATLLGPGVGRLLPNPLLIPYAWYTAAVLPPIIFAVVGILADRRRYGRAHPAWFWGIGVVIGIQIVADLIAYSPLGYQFTEWFLAGTPGAERPMEAFFPPM